MTKVYISSSWNNEFHQSLVKELRENGLEVYDFRHPNGREDVNVWDEIGADKNNQGSGHFSEVLNDNRKVAERFDEHFNAMKEADVCVLLLPCGLSSHVEAGYMAGLGKHVIAFCPDGFLKPELMYRIFYGFTDDKSVLVGFLTHYDKLKEVGEL